MHSEKSGLWTKLSNYMDSKIKHCHCVSHCINPIIIRSWIIEIKYIFCMLQLFLPMLILDMCSPWLADAFLASIFGSFCGSANVIYCNRKPFSWRRRPWARDFLILCISKWLGMWCLDTRYSWLRSHRPQTTPNAENWQFKRLNPKPKTTVWSSWWNR